MIVFTRVTCPSFNHFYLITSVNLILAEMSNILKSSLCDFVQALVTCSTGLLQLSDSKPFESVETPYGPNYEGGGDAPHILISAVAVSSSHLDNIGPRNHWTRSSYSHAGLCGKGSYGNFKGGRPVCQLVYWNIAGCCKVDCSTGRNGFTVQSAVDCSTGRNGFTVQSAVDCSTGRNGFTVQSAVEKKWLVVG